MLKAALNTAKRRKNAPEEARGTVLHPIRLDFWGGESLRGFGRDLAAMERPSLPHFVPFVLPDRLHDNQRHLQDNHRHIQAALHDKSSLTPAAEWILDNHHIVEENFRHLARDMPREVYRNLPTIRVEGDTEIPRVVALIWSYVAVTNSAVGRGSLTEIVEGFQTAHALTIGELWAVPAILRFVLLENLRRLSDRVERARTMRDAANTLADRLPGAGDPAVSALLDAEAPPATEQSFWVQMLYRLRDGSHVSPDALRWLERALHANGTTPEHIIATEHARQSSGNVSVGNIIKSLRRIDEIDWFVWFESVSGVDRVLRRDPDYERLDKSTRNAYRNAVERIARRTETEETAVALSAASDPGIGAGENLMGDGETAFARRFGYRPRVRERVLAAYRRTGWLGIFLPAVAMTLLAAALMARAIPISSTLDMTLFLAALLPASEAMLGLLSRAVARLVPPKVLPAYDFSDGVPEDARTLVVIPCLLTGYDEIDTLIRALELHYLANPQGEISFALLGDWVDSKAETRDGDAALLDHARAGIDALADRYAAAGPRRFFLLHRARLYNAADRVWMGWERKRGKLAELNQLLRGDGDTSYLDTGPRPPQGVRFVVTLDADTRLMRGTIAALAGKLAHPVNRPVSDPRTGRVVKGYGILQPRLTPSLATGTEASLFQRIFSVDRGFDPYVFTASDLYQDLLGEGTYTGKGIYDVDAFVAATEGRIPEGAVLSHDLLEGSLARAALVSDIRLVEDFPVDYAVDASRQHRGARGDWQLLPLILSPVSRLPALARMKMVDNLRRSLLAPAWVLASVLGWLTLSAPEALNWQLLLLLALFLSALLSVSTNMKPDQPMDFQLWYAGRLVRDVGRTLCAMAMRLTFLGHQAALMVDAVLRTLWRLLVTRRNLLEWRTARQAADAAPGSVRAYSRAMAASPIIGLGAIALVAIINPQNLPLAAVISLLWIVAPFVAREASQTLETADTLDIRPEDRAELRGIARSTWRFFEAFVTEESHHLPPDNYQDLPEPKLAERTSPTNIGLYLLSVVSARDFGWIGMLDAVGRIDRTLGSIARMEKHRGHLYNWYDTRTLAVLEPRYVSSVDSGNLAGHLVAVARALKEWAAAPMVHMLTDPQGVADTLRLVRQSFDAVPDDRRALRPLRRRLEERIEGFERTHATYLAEPQLAPVRAIGLSVVADDIRSLARAYAAEIPTEATHDLIWWTGALKANCEALLAVPANRTEENALLSRRIDQVAERARAVAFSMDFGFLVDPDSWLLSIGYRPDPGQLDDAHYDLLASEARLASLFAIAKGDVANRHWFRLGRPVAAFGLGGALLSWSGSMFEYLMPPLVMHERAGSILNESCMTAIARQIAYGRKLGLPWGISESAFNARDGDLNYQYLAFGAPELALKRMTGGERVVAPYASLLAAQLRPHAALANLAALEALGARGPHGFFDAVDFTPRRMPEGEDHVVVRTVMSHHQGMSICAVANAVLKGIHRDRFHSDPVIQASELLLQERAPSDVVPIVRSAMGEDRAATDADVNPIAQTVIHDPIDAEPAVGVMSNGGLAAMVSATGAGSLRLGARAVTRWRAGPAGEQGGIFLFLRDTQSGHWWSATAAPRAAPGERAEAIFSDHKAEFVKRVEGIESHLEVIVASEAHAVGHRLTLRNTGAAPRTFDVTSYGEIVLDTDAADAAHPAFSKMFVRTEVIRDGSAITARRNVRTASDTPLHLVHLLCGGVDGPAVQAETDRRAFIGRGRDLATAAAFDAGATFQGTSGFTLDPIFSLRREVRLAPGKEVSLTFWTAVAETADDLDRALHHYSRAEVFEHEARLAWTHSQVQLRHLDTTLEEAALFRQIAALLIYPDNRLAAQDRTIAAALSPQSRLWAFGISGDHPIMVIRTDTDVDLPIVGKMLRLQEFLRARGVSADLVILNERASSYVQDLQNGLNQMAAAASQASYGEAGRAHVFTLRRDRMTDEDWRLLLAAGRIVLHTRNGNLAEHLRRFRAAQPPQPREDEGPRLLPAPTRRADTRAPRDFPEEALAFWNGYGGFSVDGREYVVRLRHGMHTPHPWINVIGRPDFGFHISAEGAGYTWAANSRDYQITPWSNDPVINRPVEGIFLRDHATGRMATPFAALSDDPAAIHEARHGMGASEFRSWTDWLEVTAVQMLAETVSAKLTHVTLRNITDRTLRIDCAAFAEMRLGNDPSGSAAMIATGFDAGLQAITARNPFSPDFGDRVAAFGWDTPVAAHLTSRAAFFGAGRPVTRPEAMAGVWPADAVGTSRPGDPCAALLTRIEIAPGATADLTLVLANAPEGEIAGVMRAARAPGAHVAARDAARAEWGEFLGALQVKTPDEKLDLMVNAWLPYQALSCRVRARSAFYQASGATGFRDQLQDTAALLLHDSTLARAQILEAAGRQFVEGDVQHWWLPATGAGVRTTISDDVVWLGHVTAHYVAVTGETALLDEPVPFLQGKPLDPGEHDAFFTPERAEETAPLYDHCARALDLAIKRTGERGLPLMLGGDWNDGMNRVGEAGQGMSVWLGWFLATTLDAFVPLAQARGDVARVQTWKAHRETLGAALEAAWDGDWYRRGYYDDGTPLGSSESEECRIDSIAQSWSAISGVADPDRATVAMDSALAHLADRDEGVLRLFTPPFDKTDKEPGYIKGYPPGVRENGGQYTHAAAWMIYALGRMGRGREAVEMLDLVNPISHALTQQAAERYRVEPYVVAADVYGAADKIGRGGWTWYTGSAGWIFRAATEAILGITLEDGTHLRVAPAIPDDWPGYSAKLRHRGTVHEIAVTRDADGLRVTVNGRTSGPDGRFDLG